MKLKTKNLFSSIKPSLNTILDKYISIIKAKLCVLLCISKVSTYVIKTCLTMYLIKTTLLI